MKHRARITAIRMLLAATTLAFVAPLQAADRDELKQRFKERYAALQELKHRGAVGETYLGFVAIVRDERGDEVDVVELIKAENADRKALYQLLAEETGTSPELVARRNAERNFERAEPHHYLMVEAGVWKQKKAL